MRRQSALARQQAVIDPPNVFPSSGFQARGGNHHRPDLHVPASVRLLLVATASGQCSAPQVVWLPAIPFAIAGFASANCLCCSGIKDAANHRQSDALIVIANARPSQYCPIKFVAAQWSISGWRR